MRVFQAKRARAAHQTRQHKALAAPDKTPGTPRSGRTEFETVVIAVAAPHEGFVATQDVCPLPPWSPTPRRVGSSDGIAANQNSRPFEWGLMHSKHAAWANPA